MAPVILLPAFTPSIQYARPNTKPPRKFWRTIGRHRYVGGFDGRMDSLLLSAEDALSAKRHRSAFHPAIALNSINNAVCQSLEQHGAAVLWSRHSADGDMPEQ